MEIDSLLDKGFTESVYEDGNYLTFVIKDEILVKTLFDHLGEEESDFDFDLSGVQCTLEIKSDKSLSQYLFSRPDTAGDWFTHGELTLEQFNDLLQIIK